MPTATTTPQLIGLRLGWPDGPQAAEPLARLLAAPPAAGAPAPLQDEHGALRISRLPLQLSRSAAPASALRPTHADALLWHSDAPEVQFTKLRRLGLSPACQLTAQGAAVARLEAHESGACAMEWHGTPPAPSTTEGATDILTRRLQGLELRVPAPERTAAHWAAVLNIPLVRDADGAPLLHCAPLQLRFAPLRGAGLPGVAALLLSADASADLTQLAQSEGWTRASPVRWWVGGLQMEVMDVGWADHSTR